MSDQGGKRTAAENVALATNAAGAVGGPAAIYMAYKGAKTNDGGMPRAAVKALTGADRKEGPTRFGRTRIGAAMRRGAQALDEGKTKGAKRAAIAAGVGSVALQGANWAGDTIAARTFANKGKDNPAAGPQAKRAGMNAALPPRRRPEQGIAKAYDDGRGRRGQGAPLPRAEIAGRAYASRADRENERLGRARRNTALGVAGGAAATGVGGAAAYDTVNRKMRGEKADLLRSKSIKYKVDTDDYKGLKGQIRDAEKAVGSADEAGRTAAQKTLDDLKARASAMGDSAKYSTKSKRVLRPTGRAALVSGAVLGPAAIYGSARSHKARTTTWN